MAKKQTNQNSHPHYDTPAELAAQRANGPARSSQAAGGEPAAKRRPSNQRVYKGTQEVDHDLFRLESAKMLKNVSFNEKQPILEAFEHEHIFHTVDSNGVPQTECAPVGGHFHVIILEANPDGGVPIATCSPPMVARRDEDGRRVAVQLPAFPKGKRDEHTHELAYLGSDKIKLREFNAEAEKFMAAMELRTSPGPVAGIKG